MDPYFAERIEPDDNDCWNWTGCITNAGYGQAAGGKPAHRRSYEVHIGPIPNGFVIRHMCDNKKCCNPAHLEVGTYSENRLDIPQEERSASAKSAKHKPNHHRDMGRKGGGHNRLTPEQLKSRMDQIAHLDPTKWGYIKQVSEIWGVSHTQVRRILDSIPSTEQANGPDC